MRQVVLKSSRRVVLRWEVDNRPRTHYFRPVAGADLLDVATWLHSVITLDPARLLIATEPEPLLKHPATLSNDASPYRLVVTKRPDGRYRMTYYDKIGNGERVEIVEANEVRGRLNARMRELEIERAELPIPSTGGASASSSNQIS